MQQPPPLRTGEQRPPAPPPPPPVRGPPAPPPTPSLDAARRAIEAVKAALPYMTLGPPLLHPGPGGIHVDVPLMYQGFALDRIHYDPVSGEPRPKGMPVHAPGLPEGFRVRDFLRELYVVEAVEYREPERAWIVPLRWRVYIVAHVRVSEDGSELIPDYPLTEEVMRRVV